MSPPNTLYYGDNLDVLRRYVPDASVDLVYLDPPFNVLFAEQDGTRDAAQILNFRTEIVWKRSSAHSDAKQGRRQHGRIHDVILFYTKSDDHTWTTLYTDYDDAYVEKFYRHVEEGTNRRYQLGDLTGPGGAAKGNPEYEVMGVKRYWRYSKDRMQQLINEGRIVQTAPGRAPRYKRYLDEMPGVALQDVLAWASLPAPEPES